MPRPLNEKGSGFIRTRDQDDVRSVISIAKSMLTDTHIQANLNPNSIEQKLLPTSTYHCSGCRAQLFTNLDILIHEKDKGDLETLNVEMGSPRGGAAFTLTKPRGYVDFTNSKGKPGIESSNLRSRKLSLEQAEVATIVSGGFNNTNSAIPSVRESKDVGMPKEPLQFLDPVTGQRKCEYRCYNLFTYKLPHMSDFQDGKENYGFLYCPNRRCSQKIGIYSCDGQKCHSCQIVVVPSY